MTLSAKLTLGKKRIGEKYPVFIIAEVGINHNGKVEVAKKLIDVAKEAKADAVKFQTFFTSETVTKNAKAATYQKKHNPNITQAEILNQLELKYDDLRNLKQYAEDNELVFLSTPFDLKSLELLQKLQLLAFKISSGDLTNQVLLNHVARTAKPILISTGMANMEEIKEAIKWITDGGCDSYGIMQCTSCYPAKDADCNLNVIKLLQKTFKVPIGLSDHTMGVIAGITSVGLGARLIEKHITLDHNLVGPDHIMSMEPNDFKSYVKSIRIAEETLGDGIKRSLPCEEEVKLLGRKSIVTKEYIPKGHKITKENIAIMRPGTGIPPKFFQSLQGKRSVRDIEQGEILDWESIE